MSTPSLQHKTIRPGSLGGYSYYYSNRRAAPAVQAKAGRRRKLPWKGLAVLLVPLALIVVPLLRSDPGAQPLSSTGTNTNQTNQPQPAALAAATATQVSNHCAGNTHDKLIKISISQRRLWACEHERVVQDVPVITGMLAHPETLTPPGAYHVYAKLQDTTLSGSDTAGSWRYPVYFWMPFLDNQHGTYGFHDATWRADNEFGQVDPNSSDASHGCIELTKPAAEQLYHWAPIRTTVLVEN